jgi:hypothetical protein
METAEIIKTDPLAEQIAALHTAAEAMQSDTEEALQRLVNARIEAAVFAETARATHGMRFRQWWRTQGLPAGWDARYLRIAKTKQRLLTDPNQMLLIGQDDDDQEHGETQQGQRRAPNPLEWVNHVGRLKTRLTSEAIDAMDEWQATTAIEHLRPIISLVAPLMAKASRDAAADLAEQLRGMAGVIDQQGANG